MSNTCFVIMPITTPLSLQPAYGDDPDHFSHVFEHLFAPALVRAGFDPISPVAMGSDVIQGEIIKQLDEADLVLCDMTTLNANVFFELGIRTALDRPVATVRDTLTDRIPFDHSIVNCHSYRWQLDPWVLAEEVLELAAHVRACVDRGDGKNTLWKYFGIEAQARVGSTGIGEDDKLDYLVRQVEDLRLSVARDELSLRVASPASGEGVAEPVTDHQRHSFIVTPVVPGVELVMDPARVKANVRRFLIESAKHAVAAGVTFEAAIGSDSVVVLDFGADEVEAGVVSAIFKEAANEEQIVRMRGTNPRSRHEFGRFQEAEDVDGALRLVARWRSHRGS